MTPSSNGVMAGARIDAFKNPKIRRVMVGTKEPARSGIQFMERAFISGQLKVNNTLGTLAQQIVR